MKPALAALLLLVSPGGTLGELAAPDCCPDEDERPAPADGVGVSDDCGGGPLPCCPGGCDHCPSPCCTSVGTPDVPATNPTPALASALGEGHRTLPVAAPEPRTRFQPPRA